MKKLIDKTRGVAEKFPRTMGVEERFIDLVEEVGELAQAVLITRGKKYTKNPAKQRTVEDVADALCDVLFNLIVLADEYDLNLEEEYLAMLTRLQKRIEAKEFER